MKYYSNFEIVSRAFNRIENMYTTFHFFFFNKKAKRRKKRKGNRHCLSNPLTTHKRKALSFKIPDKELPLCTYGKVLYYSGLVYHFKRVQGCQPSEKEKKKENVSL